MTKKLVSYSTFLQNKLLCILSMFGSSSGVLRQNYVGKCKLHIFNLCHTQITQIVNTTFQLYDGKLGGVYTMEASQPARVPGLNARSHRRGSHQGGMSFSM